MKNEIEKVKEIEELYDNYCNLINSKNSDIQFQADLAEEVAEKLNHISPLDRKNFIIKFMGNLAGAASLVEKTSILNDKQIEHISSALNTVAFAEFAVFGYTAFKDNPTNWLGVILSAALFLSLEGVAISILYFSNSSEGR